MAHPLLDRLAAGVVLGDGAMGTMLQAQDPSLDDFQGHEGCNEVLNVTRPDIVRAVHDAYLEVGVDCVETNTFGANLAALAEYGIADRIHELAEAGARIARQAADAFTTPDAGGAVGWPGPPCGHRSPKYRGGGSPGRSPPYGSGADAHPASARARATTTTRAACSATPLMTTPLLPSHKPARPPGTPPSSSAGSDDGL